MTSDRRPAADYGVGCSKIGGLNEKTSLPAPPLNVSLPEPAMTETVALVKPLASTVLFAPLSTTKKAPALLVAAEALFKRHVAVSHR